MNAVEFSNQFDVLYNNITSNQAPGLNEYEKALFLTKGQDEILKNHFLAQSNPKQAGFDGNQKRQMDFSKLMRTKQLKEVSLEDSRSGYTVYELLDPRSKFYEFPTDYFLIINESVQLFSKYPSVHGDIELKGIRQVVPLSYEEYMRLMSKPYKNPLKNQAWRLLTNSTNIIVDGAQSTDYFGSDGAGAELILTNTDRSWLAAIDPEEKVRYCVYSVRYIRRPMPIILSSLKDYGNDLTINGYDGTEDFYTDGKCCELDEMVHEEILQRAVELAKVAWTATGQDNAQMVLQAGQRSE